MSALIPPEQAGDHAPYALSAPGNLEAALARSGPDRRRRRRGRVHLALRVDGRRGARAAVLGRRRPRGRERPASRAVRAALAEALRPFEAGGEVRLRNTFRWVAATR